MRRSVAVVAAAVTGVITLAACGSGSTGSEAGGSGGTADGAGRSLTVWIMEGTNPDSAAYFEQVKSTFASQTGATLDIQMVPWASAKDKFTTAIAGGTTPDVAEVGTTWTPEFAQAGALVDLTDRVSGAGLDGDLVPGLKEAGTYEGRLYGMPWYAGVRSVLYNKDVFDKAGITTPPTTWAQLTDAVTKIKQTQPNVTPFPVPGGSEFTAVPFIWGAGGELATDNGGTWTSALDQAPALEGITYLTNLAKQSSNAAAATWTEKDALTAYAKGDVGMVVAGSWTPATLRKDAPQVAQRTGAFVMPGKSGMAPSFTGGSHLGVFENSADQDLAWQFVQLMTTGDLAAKWGQESNYFPGQQSLLDKQLTSDDELTAVFAKQMTQGGKTVPVTPLWGQVQGKKVVPTMMQSILSGQADPTAAAGTAAADMNATFSGN